MRNKSNPSTITIVSGTLTSDTTWSGHVYVNDSVKIPKGICLTIIPGTFIEFRHSRGYKNVNRIGIWVKGASINATGTEESQIWFTSDLEDPINGDWGGIVCSDTNFSVFDFVIVEFAIVGIELESVENFKES